MRPRWARVALVGALLAGAAVVAPEVRPASGQPAMAFGQPLPDDKLESRTVSVRVVAGDRDKPVVGTDVTLTILLPTGGDAVERVARTDAQGRANFVDLPSGAIVTAKVMGPGGEQTSTSFAVPVTGGTRVLLSTVPVGASPTTTTGPGAPMTPAAGGAAAGQPQPRTMSGRPRAQPGDPGDTLTVRVSHDDLVDPRPPQDQPVVLVAYKFDHSVTATVVKTDPAGRAVFAGLDRSGATSYFALTTLPRGEVHDRLTTGPIQMIADNGLRLMLSGEKKDSAKPAVDDLGNLSPQPPEPIAPGVVEVVLTGVPEERATVELVEAVSGTVVSSAPAGPPLAAAGTSQARWGTPASDAGVAPTTVEVVVTVDGRPGPPLAVEIRPRGGATPAPAGGALPTPPPGPPAGKLAGVTGAGGKAIISGLPTGVEVEVVVVTPAGPTAPAVLTLTADQGSRITADVTWQERGQGGARLAGAVAGLDKAYFVRTRMHGQLHLSAPFQVTPARGAMLQVVAMPRVMLNFSLTSWVDDEYLVFTGQWTLGNSSWAPYVPTRDGRPTELVVPLPAGATGVTVRDDFAAMVGTDPKRGFVIRRPLAPGGLEFFAGFSMKIADGTVRWDMPLPLGSFESGLEILRSNPSTKLELPEGTRASLREVSDRRGAFWVLSPVTILPPQRMVFEVTGLPRPPGWTQWSKAVVGVVGVLVLLGGIGLALHRGSAVAARDALRGRYDRLLDELAGLEREDREPARRAELRAELEALRERLDAAETPGA